MSAPEALQRFASLGIVVACMNESLREVRDLYLTQYLECYEEPISKSTIRGLRPCKVYYGAPVGKAPTAKPPAIRPYAQPDHPCKLEAPISPSQVGKY